jgi:hypothetical protein
MNGPQPTAEDDEHTTCAECRAPLDEKEQKPLRADCDQQFEAELVAWVIFALLCRR